MTISIRKDFNGEPLDGWIEDGNTVINLVDLESAESEKTKQLVEQFGWETRDRRYFRGIR